MPLLTLANELILQISEELEPDTRDLNSFIRVNKRLQDLLTYRLRQLALEDKHGYPALFWATIQGHIPLLELLLDLGVDINLYASSDCDEPGEKKTALHWAVIKGKIHMVKKLIERGASVDFQDEEGHTALTFAVLSGRVDIVKVLLDAGATIQMPDRRNKWTCLFWAVFEDQLEVLEVLLENNGGQVNINSQDREQKTILSYAVECGAFRPDVLYMVELLLRKGASTKIVDRQGMKPIDYALRYPNIVHLLNKYSDNVPP